MTSIYTTQFLKGADIFLRNASNFTTDISSSPSMTSNLNLNLPPTSGTIGSVLQTNGSGNTSWGATSLPFPPVPNDDFYQCRTNQILTINVLSGVIGNTGGTDTLGGSLTSPSLSITTVTIVTNVSRGTLTNTGLGTYTYQSFPRFTGLDYFTYKVTDSSGVQSKNTAVCEINVVASGVLNSTTGIQGGHFLYCTPANNNITYYVNGVSTTLTTAQFPGGVSSTIINSLATNRDDNLIYYVNNGLNNGFIYAYDYVNNVFFLLTNARTNTLFTLYENNIAFTGSGAAYNNYNLFITCNSTGNVFYKVTLGPYITNGVTGSQTVLFVSQLPFGATNLGGDLSWNYISNTIVKIGLIIGNNYNIINICPTSALVYKTVGYTATNTFQITMSQDNVFYSEDTNNVISILNIFGATWINVGSTIVLVDMAEWFNEAPL